MNANLSHLKPLLAVAIASINETGKLIEANAGFLRLIHLDAEQSNGAYVAQYFIQPNFSTIVGLQVKHQQKVYDGLLTIGDYSGQTQSLIGHIWRENDVVHVFAEYDIKAMEELSDTVLELNKNYAKSQYNLTQINLKMKQLIDELGRRELEIRQLAFYDKLTGLPNRRLLNDRLNQAMSASKRSNTYGALMFLDLDNFKSLNDTHGHAVGDLLLIETAHRLEGCVRKIDTVARFGGDEFVVMLAELNENKAVATSQAAIVAEKIRVSLSELYVLKTMHDEKSEETVRHHCTASIGVVLFIKHESSQDDIVKWADAAMYEAKKAGRNQFRFHGEKN